LRSGNVRDTAGPLTGLGVRGLEAAAVGDDIDGVDVQNLACRFCRLRQKPHVDDLVGHRLLDDQLVLRVDGELDVVADAGPWYARPWRGCGDRSARSGCDAAWKSPPQSGVRPCGWTTSSYRLDPLLGLLVLELHRAETAEC
jgi:hypothetical protein